MDDADRSQLRLEKEQAEFARRHHPRAININGSGICLLCGDIVKPRLIGQQRIIPRWCNDECRDAWEIGQNRR